MHVLSVYMKFMTRFDNENRISLCLIFTVGVSWDISMVSKEYEPLKEAHVCPWLCVFVHSGHAMKMTWHTWCVLVGLVTFIKKNVSTLYISIGKHFFKKNLYNIRKGKIHFSSLRLVGIFILVIKFL